MMSSSKAGLFCAFSAFTLWAIAPMYFKLMSFVPATEILANRIIWSCLLVFILIAGMRKWTEFKRVLTSKSAVMALMASTVLIAVNWGTFIWAINANKMLSASLGYYINPLISILLGVVFFKDKLDRVKQGACALCFIAVLLEVINFGSLPWVALVLASTFGFYGLVRKKIAVDSVTGMALETLLLLPFALIYLMSVQTPTSNIFENSFDVNWLLFASGPITMVPLMLFATAANRVSLVTLGFMQYIGPTGMFILAVFVYGEPLGTEKLTTFALIWGALALLILDTLRKLRKSSR
ncbi:EamA family transporter RarD [Marinomonas balearica]|uniref:Chloramphenicol-sensitive protein RarD n=1 Tax=Marinomonas balearica TaxID=491947 RepID=A0A4R6MJA1_9GAMM|nr:EamA family transporter RarD [Marinomonas balearica]TDP01874.1 chloramphenicol-sensitive protein RarD [Marinomonas balearica]